MISHVNSRPNWYSTHAVCNKRFFFSFFFFCLSLTVIRGGKSQYWRKKSQLCFRAKYFQNIVNLDQSGFLKGRNIGNSIRLILDIIDYTDLNDIPGAILLLDIEKAFDSVSHDLLFQVLKHFNFRDQFISWIETIYSCRKSYIINNVFYQSQLIWLKEFFRAARSHRIYFYCLLKLWLLLSAKMSISKVFLLKIKS